MLTQIVTQALAEVSNSKRNALLQGLDEDLKSLEDCVGACERLYRTPIPLSYTYHTSRFLVFWLLALPLTLYSDMGWPAVVLAPVITFLIIGIAEIAIDLEEPFSILPLDAICNKITEEGQYLLRSADGVQALVRTETLGPGASSTSIKVPGAEKRNDASLAAQREILPR